MRHCSLDQYRRKSCQLTADAGTKVDDEGAASFLPTSRCSTGMSSTALSSSMSPFQAFLSSITLTQSS